MSGVDIEWVGAKEFGNILQKALNKSPELVGKVIQNAAEKGKKKAKGYAPVDTGQLKEKIAHKPLGTLESEFGSFVGYASFQEYGTRFQPGTKHIRPAFDDIKPELEKDIKDIARGMFK